MELWLIILLSAVGGILLLVLLVLAIWKCCCKESLPKDSKGKNGKVLQAHDHIVEVSDDEDSPNVDGLCKETISGSTFPRRAKKESIHKEEDGLCKETQDRTLPAAFLAPADTKSRSASESALGSVLPMGALVTRLGSGENIQSNKEPERGEMVQNQHGFIRKDLMPDHVIQNGEVIIHESKNRHDDELSSSSHESDNKITRKKPSRSKSMNLLKRPLERKRSKSFQRDNVVPEYTKPIKRAVSNPSFLAREKMIQKDKRFESLEAWKVSMPIPEPDYPSTPRYSFLASTEPKKDAQVEVLPSSAQSDSGVESTDTLSHDDESSTRSADSVPESPGISMPALPSKPDSGGSFLSKELRPMNDYHDHTVSYSTHEKHSYTDNGVTIITDYDNKQTNQVPAMPPLPNQSSMPAMPQLPNQSSIPAMPPLPNQSSMPAMPPLPNQSSMSSLPSLPNQSYIPPPPKSPKHSFSYQEKPSHSFKDSTPDYRQATETHSFLQQHNTALVTEKKQTTSSWVTNEQPAVDFRSIKLHHTNTKYYDHGQEANYPTQTAIPEQKVTKGQDNDAQRVLPSAFFSEQHYNKPAQPSSINAPQYTTYTTSSTHYKTTQQPQHPAVNHDSSSAPSYTTKTHSTAYKTTEIKRNPVESTTNQVDFRAFKLRPTPENIKQHIGFREELHSNQSQPTNTQEITTINDDKRPDDAYANSNLRIPTSHQSPQKTYGQNSQKSNGYQHPSNQEAGLKVFSLPSQNSTAVGQDLVNKQPIYMNGTVVSSHSNTAHAKSSHLVIQRLQEEKPVPGKAVPSTESVVMRQKDFPKPSRENYPQTEEERKKNWKREQMEQRLSTALVMGEQQPIMQASGLALKSVLPELFTKIKEKGQREESNVTIAT